MPKFELSIGGAVVIDAEDAIEAEDLAMDLLEGDILAWNNIPNETEINLFMTDIKELDG